MCACMYVTINIQLKQPQKFDVQYSRMNRLNLDVLNNITIISKANFGYSTYYAPLSEVAKETTEAIFSS